MSHVWLTYAHQFALTGVNDYILEAVHLAFLKLPWTSFVPSLKEAELMVKIAGKVERRFVSNFNF
jgi:hypothetical protein